MNSYWPISNIPILSKTLECLVSTLQTPNPLALTYLNPSSQDFAHSHGTGTALLKELNDLITSADTDDVNNLIALHLSAAFDAVSHKFNILLTRL